jgi:quercetin dioxygenase-like cupin family protein
VTSETGFVALPTDGEVANVLGIPIRLVALGKDTGGRTEVLTAEFPAGASFAAHVHRNLDEAFFVLDGELEMRVGERVLSLGTGAFGYTPRGLVHGFENKGARSATVLAWSSPAWGAWNFVQALSQLPPGPPDMERIVSILRQFDIDPVG